MVAILESGFTGVSLKIYVEQVTVERNGQTWTITRSVPNRKTVYKARDPVQAILKVIRAYGDGVTTRRLCELFGVDFVRRYRPPINQIGRTRQGWWVLSDSYRAVDLDAEV